MNILKSSPVPKMKVEMMTLTILNFKPNTAITPNMMNQLNAIGMNDNSASSRRPYDNSSAINTIKEETNSTK